MMVVVVSSDLYYYVVDMTHEAKVGGGVLP